ncbi:hypothetical protein CPLU01_09542 [Colletotrichum plurivorum]|uniref:AB hydrolase-1 domain-containing protein n=1 Tax=Colletotrichum plurivorum TaxID=2175906 RepID=A0A8H6K8D2_9PEZI|nr:hypothetical protein CPLU01_09542 [Colletotrichum plurivorum]
MWHIPTHYHPLIIALEARGYECVIPTLPSGATPPPEDPPGADVRCIRAAAEDILNSGKDVLVIAHSYGGIVASEAFSGLGVKSKGRGGARMLIYVAGFITTGNTTIEDIVLREGSYWLSRNIDPTTFTPGLDFGPIFYNDLPQEEHAKWLGMLRPGPRPCSQYAPKKKAYEEIGSVYVFCTKDLAIPLEVQEELVGKVRAGGVDVKEVRVETGHFPSLSCPGELAGIVDELVMGLLGLLVLNLVSSYDELQSTPLGSLEGSPLRTV